MTLSHLTNKQRRVVELRADFYSHKEIAQQLGMAPRTVNKHLDKARERYQALSIGEMCRRVRAEMESAHLLRVMNGECALGAA